ncbi:putative Heat shock protein 70 family [Medicago truncatula]|uniref:Putative Heat shock protein 70 family n=1 Tax=Medicago truncatula TaxID=3880 RepID=A0A396HCH2_MEDTR|nr:heat shock cognate 70 kDa protein [Medicago truncatula]RHN50926.1 putative Heat shock protein 70 family [Medicago truncatula]
MTGNCENYAIGIDLGTTRSCVAVYMPDHDRVDIIGTTLSSVSFTDTEKIIGGFSRNATKTVYDAKRLIGMKFSDDVVQSDMKFLLFKLISDVNDELKIVVNYKKTERHFTPEKISSMVLAKLKEIAEAKLGRVKDVVISVPACFSNSQRESTRKAGTMVGFNVMQIINEPSAAAIAYIHTKPSNHSRRNVFIFDLGGGTLDVSILTLENGAIKVRAVGGDTHLGGQDFNNTMVKYFVEVFRKRYKIDISGDLTSLRRLKSACEKAKLILSYKYETTIVIKSLNRGENLESKISRAKFEELNEHHIKKCMKIVEKCLEDSGMVKSDIHDVVLVGGSTRIVKLHRRLSGFFGEKKLCKSINADKAVAYGAAVHAAMLSVKQKFPLREVIPLSLGLKTPGEIMDIISPRNTKIPRNMEKVITTYFPNQVNIPIQVYEGDQLKTLLGSFEIEIPPVPAGVPKIRINFQIDHDGILHVYVSEKHLGIHNKKLVITVSDKVRRSMKEIERKINEAEKYKDEVKRRRMMVEADKRRRKNAINAVKRYAYKMKDAINDKDISFMLLSKEKKKINDAIGLTLLWLRVNHEDAKQHEIEEHRRMLSSVFDGIIVKKIKDEEHGVQENKKKNHWLPLLLKYTFQVVYIAATNDITGLISSIFVSN